MTVLSKLNKKAELVHGERQIYTDMAISAHQDDVELMCPQGIVKGYQSEQFGLVAVVCTDGGGSPRSGEYANMTNEEMMQIRRQEQISAAKIGDYADLVMLNYASAEIKDKTNNAPTQDMYQLLLHYQPSTVYIHNLADKHPTHINVAVRCINAIRALDKADRPRKLYGCEVWRNLDWLPDSEKVVFDLSGYDDLLDEVLGVHRSQIAGGKRYDLAAQGRRLANATFNESHGVDKSNAVAYAMDLTPLIVNDNLDIREFVLSAIDRFKAEILV